MPELGEHATEVLTSLEPGKAMIVPSTIDHSPAGILANALDRGMDIDKLERILELQIKYEENEAKKAYHKAMAAFKANPPEILKDRHVKYSTKTGQTEYKHASLGNVSEAINRGLGEHGLSAAWIPNQKDGGMVTVTCTITHELGHSESASLSAGLDQSGGKNNIQSLGSTLSYLERYTVQALTGLASKDIDDDGVASEQVEYIKGKDLAHIVKMHKDLYNNPNDPKFWEFAGATKWEEIPMANHDKILAMLNARKVAQAETRDPGEDG